MPAQFLDRGPADDSLFRSCRIPHGPGYSPPPVHLGNDVHVRRIELEGEDVEVLPDAFRACALGKDRKALLDGPAEEDLSFRDTVLCGQGLKREILACPVCDHRLGLRAVLAFRRSPTRQRNEAAVRDGLDPGLLEIGNQFRLLRPRVEFDLVGIGQRQPCLLDLPDMIDAVPSPAPSSLPYPSAVSTCR